jgi:hypothetical protein
LPQLPKDLNLNNHVYRALIVGEKGRKAHPRAIAPALRASSPEQAKASRWKLLEMNRLNPQSFHIIWRSQEELYEIHRGNWEHVAWQPDMERKGAWLLARRPKDQDSIYFDATA